MLEIVTGATLLMSAVSLHANASGAVADTFATNTERPAEVEIKIDVPKKIEIKPTYETEVRDTFKDSPLLVDIAKCESGFAQYDKNGDVLRGKVNPKDVGIMQINEGYHLERAKSLGYDIYSVEGNLTYAKYMYEHENGADPWTASAPCWSKVKTLTKK
ncbi:MAG: hypothetical protein WCP15_01095 [bacterium]